MVNDLLKYRRNGVKKDSLNKIGWLERGSAKFGFFSSIIVRYKVGFFNSFSLSLMLMFFYVH